MEMWHTIKPMPHFSPFVIFAGSGSRKPRAGASGWLLLRTGGTTELAIRR
jgi:hypothetical protein